MTRVILIGIIFITNFSLLAQDIRVNRASIPKASESKQYAQDGEVGKEAILQVQMQKVKQLFKINPNTKDYQINETFADDALLRENAFAQLYYNYLKSDPSQKDYVSLIGAYQLYPQNKELTFEMIQYYEKTNQLNLKKSLVANYGINLSLQEYGYNLLQSVDNNGILITYGTKDSYSVWYNQEIKKIRTDVKVINYDLLRDDDYRITIKKRYNLQLNNSYTSGVVLLKDLGIKNNEKSIYYSASISKLLLKDLQNKLYPTGLAFKFSNTNIANDLIKENWNKFQLTTLMSKQEKELKMNYILPLYWMIKNNDKRNDREKIESTALKLGELNGKKQQVQQLFKNL